MTNMVMAWYLTVWQDEGLLTWKVSGVFFRNLEMFMKRGFFMMDLSVIALRT